MSSPPSRLRAIFLWSSAAVLVAFGLLLAGLDRGERDPRNRVLRLMPAIAAELMDAPLGEAEAAWPLESSAGTVLRLGDLPRDTLVFLNFWATWCPPCRDELPSMLRLREALADRRFLMVAVSYDDDWATIRGFFARWLGQMPSDGQLVVLRDGAAAETPGGVLRQRFGTDKLPDTYVIYNGRILARFVNARDWLDPAIVEYFKTLAPAR